MRERLLLMPQSLIKSSQFEYLDSLTRKDRTPILSMKVRGIGGITHDRKFEFAIIEASSNDKSWKYITVEIKQNNIKILRFVPQIEFVVN